MADSVARRPHTATSVRGLISPPSPILVVWLPFTVFPSSLPLTCLHLLIPPLSYSLSQYSLPSVFLQYVFRLIVFIFSLVDPSVALYLLALPPIFHSAPSRLLPAASILSSSLAVRLKLLILLLNVFSPSLFHGFLFTPPPPSPPPIYFSRLSRSAVSGSSTVTVVYRVAVGSSYDTVQRWAKNVSGIREIVNKLKQYLVFSEYRSYIIDKVTHKHPWTYKSYFSPTHLIYCHKLQNVLFNSGLHSCNILLIQQNASLGTRCAAEGRRCL